MSDLISRSAALKSLGEPPPIWQASDYEIGMQVQWSCDFNAIKSVLPAQPEPQWMPCSERLPETDKARSYWVCTDAGYQCQCRWSNDMYGLGANEYSEWGWHIMDKPQYARVIAWMPLPAPYAERREE